MNESLGKMVTIFSRSFRMLYAKCSPAFNSECLVLKNKFRVV